MPDAITISQKDDGQTVHASPGAELTVTLPENRTTGFRWHLGPYSEQVLSLESNEYERPSGSALGAGGKRRFRFRAAGEGKAALSFHYSRTWEAPEDTGREFSVSIEVK